MTEQNRGRTGWQRFALPASIVLNLFLIALIGGHVLSNRRPEEPAGGPLTQALARAEASLSPQDAAAFGAVIRRDAPEFLDAARQSAKARARLGQEIVADPFDPVRVRQALAAWQVAWDHFVVKLSDPLVDALGAVSPEGRRKLIAQRRSERLTPFSP